VKPGDFSVAAQTIAPSGRTGRPREIRRLLEFGRHSERLEQRVLRDREKYLYRQNSASCSGSARLPQPHSFRDLVERREF